MLKSCSRVSVAMSEEIFLFCLEVISREFEKFQAKLSEQYGSINAETTHDADYNKPENRLEFLYTLALSSIVFAKHCFKTFFSQHSAIAKSWLNQSDLELCIISNGPALEYVALLLQLREHLSSPNIPGIKNLTVLSKYGGWKNTIDIVNDVVVQGNMLRLIKSVAAKNITTRKFNLLTAEAISDKAGKLLRKADVIIVMKPVGLPNNKNLPQKLRQLCENIKPGAFLVCIETKPVADLFAEALSNFSGGFLYGPEHFVTRNDSEFYENFKKKFGHGPESSSKGSFFVWKRYFSSSHVFSGINESTEYLESSNPKHLFQVQSKRNLVDRSNETPKNIPNSVDIKKRKKKKKLIKLYEKLVDCSTEGQNEKLVNCSTEAQNQKLVNCSTEAQNEELVNCPAKARNEKLANDSTEAQNQKLVNSSTQTEKGNTLVNKSVRVSEQNINMFGSWKLVSKSTQTQDVLMDKSVKASIQNECHSVNMAGTSVEIQEGNKANLCSNKAESLGSTLEMKTVLKSDTLTHQPVEKPLKKYNVNIINDEEPSIGSTTSATKETSVSCDSEETASLHAKMQHLTKSIYKLIQVTEVCFDKIVRTKNDNIVPSDSRGKTESKFERTSHTDCTSPCSHCNYMMSNGCKRCKEISVTGNVPSFSNEDSTYPKVVLDLDSLDDDIIFQIISGFKKQKAKHRLAIL